MAPAKDPNKPKRPATPFFVFMEKFRVTFKKENPDVKGVSAVGKAGGEKWRSMSAAEKAPYLANAAKRKTEHLKLMKLYNIKKQEREAESVEEVSDESSFEDDSDGSTSTSEVGEESVQLLDDDSDSEILEPKKKRRELVKNVSITSDSVEKFSPQSDIVCVKGYNVNRKNATILEAIFKKHGDIAAACDFRTDSMRASILEVVCEVVRQMQTNGVIEKMEELERSLLDAEKGNIDVTWLRAHLEAISKRKETSEKYSMLMKMKEKTTMLKKVVQVDWRERCSEHAAAKQRLEKAEKCMKVLQLIEKNLDENILESKDKIDSCVNHLVV